MKGETMVPEGLEWQSVEEIVDRIASIGFNFVRLYVLPTNITSQ
jgi:endoglucanase